MDEKQDFSDLGEKLRRALQDAADTGDFGQINAVVNDTVNSALQEVRHQVNQVHEKIVRPLQDLPNREFGDKTTERRAQEEEKESADRRHRPMRTAYSSDREHAPEKKELPARYYREPGRLLGIFLTGLGGVGLGVFGLSTILAAGFIGSESIGALIAPGVIAAGFGVMLARGNGIRTRLQRARRYFGLVREKMYIGIEELASRTGQSTRRLRRDMKKMIRAGIFPEGHLDSKETFFVLDDATWNQYLITRKEWEDRQDSQEQEPPGEGSETAWQIERDSAAYLNRLRQLNDRIPGEVISEKLFRLDRILQNIFAALREHPEKYGQMRRFMDYYLPTTVKLVEAYADFDQAGVQGENIRAAKEEIEKTLDTINQAFEKLLDDIYQDDAIEATADAKVLKTLLAQDGYGENNF